MTAPTTKEQREEMFWANVEKTPTCWLWTGRCTADGYPKLSNLRAYRYAYELLVGPIPEGLQIDHLCRVRHCVNPEHLEPVTGHENWRRGDSIPAQHARQTHCISGHEFNDENTVIDGTGSRHCRVCKAAYMRVFYLRRKAARAALLVLAAWIAATPSLGLIGAGRFVEGRGKRRRGRL